MRPEETASAEGGHVYDRRVAARFAALTTGFWRGERRLVAFALTFGLAACLFANVGVQVAVNAWNGWFFNALEKRDAVGAWNAALVFAGLVVVVATIGVGIVWFRETLQVHWRAWVTRAIIDRWFAGNAFYQLGARGVEPANPEYRIADDVRMALEPIVDFAIGLFSAVLAAAAFIGVLWTVGGALNVGGVSIPAYMVLGALAYGIFASALMLHFGKPLVGRVGARNEAEAGLRYVLTDTRAGAGAVVAEGREGARRAEIDGVYANVVVRWLAVVRQNAKLTWITNGSGALIPVVPLMLAAPKYFAGELTLGNVVQLAAAFVQVQIAISWLVDNYRRIAECYASVRRVVELDRAIQDVSPSDPDATAAAPAFVPPGLGWTATLGTLVAGAVSRVRLRWGSQPIGSSGTKRLTIALLAVTAVWALALWQWVAGDLVVPWDSKNQFYAFFRFMAQAIHAGASPFWNPYHYAGHPSIADPQSLVFSPPFLLWAMFDPAPSLRTFDVIVFAHLLVGAWALATQGHRLGWPIAASVLAASVFMLGGVVAGRANHTGIVISYALFPLAFLLLEVMLSRRSYLAAIGFAAVAASIALGRTQVPLFLCLVLVAFALRAILVAERPWRFVAARAGVLAAAVVTGLALLAVPMLLTAQFALQSNRPEIELADALRSSLYPVNFANMFVPNIFGSLWTPTGIYEWGPGQGTRGPIDITDRAFNYLFAGSLTVLLLVWHGLSAGRIWVQGRRTWLLVGLVALVYALGRATPIFPWLFENVPGVAIFRRPNDAMFVMVLASAYLVGHLAADYVRDGLPRARWWALALLVAGVAGLFDWALAFSAASGRAELAAWEIAKVAPIYLALVLALVLARGPIARRATLAILVTFTAGELVWRNAGSSLNAEPRAVYAILETPTGEDARIVETLRRELARRRPGDVRPRVEIVGLGGPWQNAAMVLGFEATNGYNPLRIGAYDRLVAPGESPYTVAHRLFPASFPGYDCLLSRHLGLEYVVLDRPIEQVPHLAHRPVADVVMAGPKAWIYRLHDPTPRVKLARAVRVEDADRFIDEGTFLTAHRSGDVSVDDDEELTQSYAGSRTGDIGRAAIVSWSPDRTEVEVEARVPTILSLQSPWYPGWEVTVNGERRPVLRTNVLFRGVEVPAGRHRVVFTYRPLSIENLVAAARDVFAPDAEDDTPEAPTRPINAGILSMLGEPTER